MSPRLFLHLEGATVLAASVFAYQHRHGSWILFAALFLAPDLSMIGYLRNARVGAAPDARFRAEISYPIQRHSFEPGAPCG
jgi:hypothetical protein